MRCAEGLGQLEPGSAKPAAAAALLGSALHGAVARRGEIQILAACT